MIDGRHVGLAVFWSGAALLVSLLIASTVYTWRWILGGC